MAGYRRGTALFDQPTLVSGGVLCHISDRRVSNALEISSDLEFEFTDDMRVTGTRF